MAHRSLDEAYGGGLRALVLAGLWPVLVFLLVLAPPAQAAPSSEETEAAASLEAYLENKLPRPVGDGTVVEQQEVTAAAVPPQWLMGPISSSYYNDPLTGLLFNYTMEQVGYYGATDASYPRVGDLYYGVIGVGNASPDLPAFPVVDVTLPRDTRFDIDPTVPQKRIKCYLHNFNTGAMQELTGDLCPTRPSPGIHGWNFNPPGGLELSPGYMIEIQFPIRSSRTLQGLADPTGGSCLVGAVRTGFFDDVPRAGEKCPLADNHGTYQGVFVSEAPDTIKPTVSGMSPRHASVVRDTTPTVRATIRDNLTNLRKGNIKLYMNGRLIPATRYSYNAATDVLVYNSPRLAKGKKTVRIVATDAAKNVGARSWYFTIR